MTGYGKCVVSEQTRSLTVEMKAVNNRYLEINVRLPKVLAPFENDVKTVIKSRLSRGSVDVFLTYASEAESHVAVDEAAARAYLDAAKTLSEKFTLVNDYSVTDLMKAPGVVAEEAEDESEDELRDIVVRATAGAVDALDKMRAKEGEGVTKNLRDLADNIDSRALQGYRTRAARSRRVPRKIARAYIGSPRGGCDRRGETAERSGVLCGQSGHQ